MKNIKNIGVVVLSLLLIGSIMPLVSADSSNVTVTWVIPADVSISLTYPTGEGKIVFQPGAKTFTNQTARSQTPSTAGMNITNNGNTALQINFTFQDAWYDAGLSFFNCSRDTNTNATRVLYWTNSNETTNTTAVSSLGIGLGRDFWFWSSGTNCQESAEGSDTETFIVYYTNV